MICLSAYSTYYHLAFNPNNWTNVAVSTLSPLPNNCQTTHPFASPTKPPSTGHAGAHLAPSPCYSYSLSVSSRLSCRINGHGPLSLFSFHWLWLLVICLLVFETRRLHRVARGSPVASKTSTVKRPKSSLRYVSRVLLAPQYHGVNDSSTDGLLAASFLMLTLVVPTQLSPTRQRIQVYLWTAVILLIFSVLISLFKIKNRGMSIMQLPCNILLTSMLNYRLSFQNSLLKRCKIWIDLRQYINI